MKLTRTDDPAKQCRGLASGGRSQCPYEAVPGSNYCYVHGGNQVVMSTTQTANKTYLELDKTEYQIRMSQRIAEVGTTNAGKSLDDEIGVLVVQLERVLGSCQDNKALFARNKEIVEIINALEKLKKTNMTLKEKSGELMSLDEAQELASQLLSVLNEEVSSWLESLVNNNPEVKFDPRSLMENVSDRYAELFVDRRDKCSE